MKKNVLIWTLIFAFCACMAAPAVAEAGAPSDQMFANAKAALTLMSAGSYADALEILGFDENSLQDFSFFCESSFSTLSDGVQETVAVAYRDSGKSWILAIPLQAPDAMDVETFLLRSSDGKTFDAYTAAAWETVDSLVSSADGVIWCYRYEPDGKYVIAS